MSAPADRPSSSPATRRPVDAVALERAEARLLKASEAPWLHWEVARRMAERLSIVKTRPRVVLDWGARLGGGRSALQAAYHPAADRADRADILPVEPATWPSAARLKSHGSPWWSLERWRSSSVPPLAPAKVETGSAQLVWSNMTLHGQADPAAVFSQWHRALAVDGFLMFSTLGPGTLPELRDLYAARGWGPPMAPLVDMHDLGDMLVAAGFADPVMDQELIVLTWPSAQAALDELRSLGANVDPRRCAGLRTPRWRSRLLQALEEQRQQRDDERVALTFEVAYGHAFRPAARARVAPEARVDLVDFQAMARQRRR